MAGEAQYINPIIQSMFETANLSQKVAERKQQSEQFKAEQATRDAALKLHEKEIDRLHDQFNALLEKVHLPQLQSELAKNKIIAMEGLQKFVQGGGDLSQLGFPQGKPQQNLPNTGNVPLPPELQPQPTFNIPGVGENVNPAGFGSPEQAAEIARIHAQAIAAGTGQGQLPSQLKFLEAQTKSHKDIQKDENDFRSSLQKAEEAWKTGEDKLDRDNRIRVEGMANATSLTVAHISHDITPDQFRAGVFDAATGQSAKAYTGDNLFDRAVQTGVQQNGMRLFPLKDREAAQQMTRLLPVFGRMEDWADKYLPHESQYGDIGASALAIPTGALQKALPTDAKKDLQTIQGQALVLGKGLEGMTGGRFNNKQLELDLNSIGGVGQTAEQAKRGIAALKDTYLTQQQNSLMGGMPEEQKQLNYKTWGIAPPWLLNAPRQHPTIKRQDGSPAIIDYDSSIAKGQPVYN